MRSAVVGRLALATGLLIASVSCSANTVLQQLLEARQLSTDLLVRFTQAADASNRAVMADTDETSTAFAREADQAAQAVQQQAEALGPVLQSLGFSKEATLLEEFRRRFARYRELDKNILELAVENTNLKAQRLSFGPALGAVDALRTALEGLKPRSASSQWQIRALAAEAVASANEIVAVQAPHIAAADDEAMTGFEKRMAAAEAAARTALSMLEQSAAPDAEKRLAAARSSLDHLMTVNKEIVALSRRNSDVHSLALSLNQKRTVTAECEESLRALQDALGSRTFAGTR